MHCSTSLNKAMDNMTEIDAWVAIFSYVLFVASGPLSHKFRASKVKANKAGRFYFGILLLLILAVFLYALIFFVSDPSVIQALLTLILYIWPVALILRADMDVFSKVLFDQKNRS